MKGVGQLPSNDNLLCFIAAARQLNFRRAAAEMSLTPTAFGQRIRQLEEQLDVALFTRTTRHVELTQAGRALLPTALEAVESVQRCADAIHSDPTTIPLHLTLGTRFELGLSWLVPTLAALREDRPNWHIDLYFGSGPDILARLEAGRLEAVVTSAPVARSGWESVFLHPEHYVLCGSAALLERVPFDRPEDAANHNLLDVDRDLPLTRYFTSSGPALSFADIWLLGTGAAVHRFVQDEYGVAVLPEYMVRKELEDGSLVRILPDIELLDDSFRILFRTASHLSRPILALADYLRERPLE